jgi:predicted RNase H-like nuclease (RuvC/YqgF family)
MSNSLNIGEKIKYVFGALEIAKRNREGRELEIIKSANRMVEQLETELADKEKQLAEARAEIERLKRCCNCEYANHKLEICEHPDNEPETFMDGVCDLWSHNI